MRKDVFAGVALAFIGLGVAAPAAAEDWRACTVGACLKAACGNNDASVVVSMGTNVDDPAVGGTSGLQNALLRSLQQRAPMSGQPIVRCTDRQPSQGAADQLSHSIFAQMSTTFYDVRLISPNDLILGYDSVPGSEDPRYNGGATADAGAGAEQAAQAEAQAAAAQREREQQAAAAAAERERQAAQQAREQAAAEAERRRVADEARARERAAAEAAAAAKSQASTSTDANRCVSAPLLRENASFQGNTAASVTNGCGEKVDVRICLMRETGEWNCGMTTGLAPQASWSWSSFRATGQVFMDARVSGSGRPLNSP